ncbi:hypothetical protein JXA85_02390 [Candidatus Woesearchaeota archaeon]|nr:hypothetical protein [Candidatus Woesearchaeota archaeon]
MERKTIKEWYLEILNGQGFSDAQKLTSKNIPFAGRKSAEYRETKETLNKNRKIVADSIAEIVKKTPLVINDAVNALIEANSGLSYDDLQNLNHSCYKSWYHYFYSRYLMGHKKQNPYFSGLLESGTIRRKPVKEIICAVKKIKATRLEMDIRTNTLAVFYSDSASMQNKKYFSRFIDDNFNIEGNTVSSKA